MSVLNFNVNGISKSATKLESKARSFNITIDEPEDLGGKDEGPNPVEYILAGYAGCLNVVLNLVAKEKGIQINSLKLDVNGDLNPSKLLGGNEDRAGFRGINVNIEIDSPASKEELEVLLFEAKGRCPVNDTIANPTPIQYAIKQQVFVN
jgi:uncharacterized OsmC-like protein